MSTVLYAVISLVIGFLIGFFLKKYLTVQTPCQEENQALHETQQAFKAYRTQMSEHFQKTAQLLSQLQNQHDALQQHVYAATQHVNQEQHLTNNNKKTEKYLDPSIAAARKTQQVSSS